MNITHNFLCKELRIVMQMYDVLNLSLTKSVIETIKDIVIHNTKELEIAIIGIGRVTSTDLFSYNLVVERLIEVPYENLLTQEHKKVCVDPQLIMRIMMYCKKHNLSFVFMHTHPYNNVIPTNADTIGEKKLMNKALELIPNAQHAVLIVGKKFIYGNIWGNDPIHYNSIKDLYILSDDKKEIIEKLTKTNNQFAFF